MSDLEYLDRYPATVDCAENTIRSGTPAPTVLHPLELLRVGEHAGVLASVKALDQFRYQQKGFAIEALQLLRRSARQLYRIAQSNRQTEIGLDLAPGNTRAIVFFDSLRKVHWRTCAENVEPFISANAAIHSFSFGSNRIADAVIAIETSFHEFTLSTQYVVKRLRCQRYSRPNGYRMRRWPVHGILAGGGVIFRRIDRILR